jgi:hypothetical protein
MGFSGGGSNVLKPHTHDGTVTQDGGSLNMDNVTQAALTSGDVVYSDGVHLQRLAIGSTGDSLQVSGSNLPAWATASAGSQGLVHYELLASDDTSITANFTAVDQDDISEIYVVACCIIDNDQVSTDLQVNGIMASNYNFDAMYVENGTVSTYDNSAASNWFVGKRQLTGDKAMLEAHITAGNTTIASTSRRYITGGGNWFGEMGNVTWSGKISDNPITSINEVKLTGSFLAGSYIAVYRHNVT